jgi:hypothetical protein
LPQKQFTKLRDVCKLCGADGITNVDQILFMLFLYKFFIVIEFTRAKHWKQAIIINQIKQNSFGSSKKGLFAKNMLHKQMDLLIKQKKRKIT